MNATYTIKFDHISKQHQHRVILSDLSLQLEHGQCLLLTGQNGAGKTTLLRIIGGLEKPDQFTANTGFNSLNWRRYKKTLQMHIMYMHQQPYMFEGDVYYNLEYALSRKLAKQERHVKIMNALDWADLNIIAHSQAKSLSGGECQRVALTRAWLRQPKILLLDEPTANMDQSAKLKTIQLLDQLRNEGMTLLIASHDPDCFTSIVDTHLHLSNGKLTKVTSSNSDTAETTNENSRFEDTPIGSTANNDTNNVISFHKIQ